MTLQRVESGFGNSSCSSMASFMSELLQESFAMSEVPLGEIQIDIVDDNAKVEVEHIGEMHRTRSLVTMRRQRSGRQLSRWACTYQRQDSDPHLMMATRAPRKAPRGSSSKFLTTTSDSMLLNLPTRTLSPKLANNEKTRMSSTMSSKGRLGNATWSNADVKKSTNRVVPSQIFDLSLDISPGEEKNKLNPNPFLMDRLSSMSLMDETKSCMPMQQKLDREQSPLRSDSQHGESAGIRKPVRRPSVQRTIDVHLDKEDEDVKPYQRPDSKYEDTITANAMDMLNSITLSGSSSVLLNDMTRIRDPSALGIQMPNRTNRISKGRVSPENQLAMQQQQKQRKSSKSQSASKMSSGMKRVSSSSSKGLGPASFEESLRRSSSKSLDSKKFLKDPSLLGLSVTMGTR